MSLGPGSKVLVQWSDGNQYEASVVQLNEGQVLISFPGGEQHWVGQQYVSPAAPAAPTAAAPAAPTAQVVTESIGSVEIAAGGSLEVEGGIRTFATPQDYLNYLQTAVDEVEAGGISLAGVDAAQPITFFRKQCAIRKAIEQGTPEALAIQQQGFASERDYYVVTLYVTSKWSYIGTDDNGKPAVLQRDEYVNAMLEGNAESLQQDQAAAAAADPNLLAPVGGVSVEQWGQASVALGQLGEGATDAQVAEALAGVGMDQASWDAANAGWQAKMQGDETGAIATKFGEAFATAQSAGAAAAGGAGGDAEPCTFDTYCEIMAAQAAWSEQGFDINAKLQETFGIDIMGYSGYSSYWGVKMATDIALMTKYAELDAKYRAKYAGASMDDDLQL